MNPIEKIKAAIKNAENCAQAEAHAIRANRKQADLTAELEIVADSPHQYAKIQAERLEQARTLRLRERVYDAGERVREILNDESYKPMLIEALAFLKALHHGYQERHKQTLIERLCNFVKGLDEEAEEAPAPRPYSLNAGVYGADVVLTPKERLEALEAQVNIFPADHELQRIVGDMTGIYAVLTAPLPKPKAVNKVRPQPLPARFS